MKSVRNLPATLFAAYLMLWATACFGEGWSLWPKKNEPAPRPPANVEPSLFTKMANGTSKFLVDTKDTLTFNKKSPPPRQPNPLASRPKTKSWFDKMFGPEEPQKAKTPSEWITQKRPDF